MAYSVIKKPSDYFNTKLYTGNSSSTHAVTGVGFQPDLSWFKNRTGAGSHYLFDAIRGVTKSISSDTTSAEATQSYLSSFDTDGFTLGSASNNVNGAYNYASWNWLANGTGVANTDGDIASTVSANTTSGFSIVSYTGTGANATVGHGLGAVPKVIITKSRSNSSYNWTSYFASLGNTGRIRLNLTDAATTGQTNWNSTTPTSSVFSLGTNLDVNGSGENIIAYCFAEKQGFSKFGSYTGNGNADGTFVYTGFKPAFVMIKRTDSADGWQMFDNKRDLSNPGIHRLEADSSAAEYTGQADHLDMYSNGFKPRYSGGNLNGSGATYIYMAFAEQPLVGDNPATAR